MKRLTEDEYDLLKEKADKYDLYSETIEDLLLGTACLVFEPEILWEEGLTSRKQTELAITSIIPPEYRQNLKFEGWEGGCTLGDLSYSSPWTQKELDDLNITDLVVKDGKLTYKQSDWIQFNKDMIDSGVELDRWGDEGGK